MESLHAVYSSLVQSREDYRQSTEILCRLWAVYRQSRYFSAVYGKSTSSLWYFGAVYWRSTGSLGQSTGSLGQPIGLSGSIKKCTTSLGWCSAV